MEFIKRFSNFMDELLPKLAVVTQKVNTYTGTDYSGVEALRREIQEQENLVKARRLAIETAKQVLDTALSHQASSQKKVVALLERKHSWSASDLESYMALIRSEHTNDQAVREGKEAVTNAENALEDARGQLEKRERAQYHEEQIWSDTIRRNSTWVTFGLMGFNIFLLLLSLLVFEPWRRRRMVREIKTVLETQKGALETTSTAVNLAANARATYDLATIKDEVDRVTESENFSAKHSVVGPPIAAGTEGVMQAQIRTIPEAPVTPREVGLAKKAADHFTDHKELEGWRKIVIVAQDIVSDRVILIRRVDYTTAILQGAAAGATLTAAIFAMTQFR